MHARDLSFVRPLSAGRRLAAMTTPSANPFAMLNEDDDDAPAVVAAKKEDVKRAPNAAPKKDAPKPVSAKDSDKRGPPRDKDGKRPPKREFDRHSGTGRGARSDGHEEKKGGHGKGNWGGDKDTTQAEDGEPRELTEEEIAAKEAAAEERRKEAAALTLEEYRKKQQAAGESTEVKAARLPEALDMKGLKIKADPDDVEDIVIGESKAKKQAAKEKKGKQMITDLNFVSPPIETASPSAGRGSFLTACIASHPQRRCLVSEARPGLAPLSFLCWAVSLVDSCLVDSCDAAPHG